jgi:hypothetical protein
MDEKQLIAALHEQLAIWMKESKKKDKWNYYSITAKVLKEAEAYLGK